MFKVNNIIINKSIYYIKIFLLKTTIKYQIHNIKKMLTLYLNKIFLMILVIPTFFYKSINHVNAPPNIFFRMEIIGFLWNYCINE